MVGHRDSGAAPPRVVIENVTPHVDAGRFPAKRILGDALEIGADVYKDGHDRLGARISFLRPGEREWDTAALSYRFEPDRWFGSIELDRVGRWRFTVEAWADPWTTWREDLRKRVDVKQDVASELLEGAEILLRAAKSRGGSPTLEAAAERIGGSGGDDRERVCVALSREAARLVDGPIDSSELTRHARVLEVQVDRPLAGFGAWYELFPRSQAVKRGRHGTFKDAQRQLPKLAKLGFDVVYLPPIHPIGRTHRKGRNNVPVAQPGDVGSPWAIGAEEGGHEAVHPELGTLADFERFVRRAEELGLEVALDYALQCSPDHPWAREHPEWFHVRPDGTIRCAENPPKLYQDIYPLNFWCEDRESLWNACKDLLELWIERGVRIFRVDNPHTKPFAFWEWILQEIGRAHPEVIFLAEAFTRPKRMYRLAKLGFTQSYSHFTWKNTTWELREYFTELTGAALVEYYRPNLFTNTPDILTEYLQTGGRPAFRVRLLLAATLSPIYGIYSGFELCENIPVHPGSEEYLDSEKYEIRQRGDKARNSLTEEIGMLNHIRRANPALQRLDNLEFLDSENEQVLWYRKSAPQADLLIAVNLDPHHVQEAMVQVPLRALGLGEGAAYGVEDLLTGERYRWQGARNYVRLDPVDKAGHVLRLVAEGS